jgi:acyl dehydratase
MEQAAGPAEYPAIGEKVGFSRTITEADVYLFAGLTRDYADIHLNEEYARQTPYGRRLVHGAYLIGLMSGASAIMDERIRVTNVSYGYDKVRFRRPVFIGDTVRIEAEVAELRPERREIILKETCTTQNGELAAIAFHVLKLV